MAASSVPSDALRAANRRLLQLRAELSDASQGDTLPWETPVKPAATAVVSWRDVAGALPGHMGWGSERLTAVLRAADRQEPPAASPPLRSVPSAAGQDGETPAVARAFAASSGLQRQHVKLYPDIAAGMLRQEQAAAGRLWLLCRFLDGDGRGWLRIVNIREHFSTKTSNLRICGKRQLRNLLREGDGIFWTRDKRRLWLRSAAKVAAALSVERLTGRPVALPVTALTDTIGTVRAHLYASFHSGRERAERQRPIARDTLEAITGVGRRSQLAYEQQVGLDVQHNFAVGAPVAAQAAVEERAWHNGQATFVLLDSQGQQGRPGRAYIAWQLPNTYGGCHRQCRKGRQRRINRELGGLVVKGGPGNGEESIEKRYFPNGRLAAAAAKQHDGDVYWRRQQARSGRYDVWQAL